MVGAELSDRGGELQRPVPAGTGRCGRLRGPRTEPTDESRPRDRRGGRRDPAALRVLRPAGRLREALVRRAPAGYVTRRAPPARPAGQSRSKRREPTEWVGEPAAGGGA